MGTAAPGFPRSHSVSYWHAGAQASARRPAAAVAATLPEEARYPGVVRAAIVVGGSLALWAAIAAALRLALG